MQPIPDNCIVKSWYQCYSRYEDGTADGFVFAAINGVIVDTTKHWILKNKKLDECRDWFKKNTSQVIKIADAFILRV